MDNTNSNNKKKDNQKNESSTNKKEKEKLKNKELLDEKIFKELDNLCELKNLLDLTHIKINEKAINKALKEKPFKIPIINKKLYKDKKEDEKDTKEEEKEKDIFDCCQYYMFPSGITKTTKKNFKTGEEKEEKIDYSGLDEKVYEKFKKNPTRELDILIGNTGYLFNNSSLMVSVVKKRISGYYLWDRLYIWKYYIKSLDDTEKIKLIRNFLYRLKLFFQRYYEELMKIDKIKNAYNILKKKMGNEYDEKEWNKFYISSKMLGYNPDGTVKKDNKINEKTNMSVLLEDKIKLNVQNELNGNGAGLILVKELSNFSNMILISNDIFEKLFEDCFDLLSSDFKDNYIKLHCIFFKYFDNYILSNNFMAKMFEQLLLIYCKFKQDTLVNYLHKLVIPKFNAFDELEQLEKSISKRIGNDIIYDNEKIIEKFQNTDDLLNYIETDNKPKKKKKKKKNNNSNDPINQLEKLHNEIKFGSELDEDIYEGKEIPDNISVMSGVSEADSIVRAFKNDIRSFNFSGEKLKANLSDSFVYNIDND